MRIDGDALVTARRCSEVAASVSSRLPAVACAEPFATNAAPNRLLWEIATVAIASARRAAHLPRRFLSRLARLRLPARLNTTKSSAIAAALSVAASVRIVAPGCSVSRPHPPGSISIMAGTLDDSIWFTPQADIYTASAQPWDYMNPDLPKFPGLPQNVSQGP
jgi:hypothetical protein